MRLYATDYNVILTPLSEEDVSEDQLEAEAEAESSLTLFKVYSIGPKVGLLYENGIPFKVNDIVVVSEFLRTLFLENVEYAFTVPQDIFAVLR